MKNFILAIFALSLLNSCVGVKGNGNVETTNRQVESFSGIQVSGAINVFVKLGEVQSVQLTADANLLPLIKTTVSGGELVIRTNKSVTTYEKLNVYIVIPRLKSVKLNGASTCSSQGLIKSDNLEIEVSGASEVNMEVECSDLELELSGASEITLKGTAENVEIEASGASDVKAYSLIAESADIDASGASDVKITVKNKIDAEASGASSISFKGNPQEVRQSNSGASSINSK